MRFIIGLIVGLLIFPISMYCYFRFGYAPVATAARPIPFEVSLAHMGLHQAIEKDAPKSEPFKPTEADFENASHLYREHCAVCHGVMGGDKSPTAKGMYPKPPQLLHGKGVTDDPAGETYWKVSNGIRLTGMPAYKGSLTDKEMWQISFLLAQADKLPDSVKQVLQQRLKEQ